MKKLIYAILCYVLLTISSSAQTLNPDQLRADFDRFRTALNEVHPEMYRYTPKPVFDSLFAATAAQLNRSMTQQEFYGAMNPLLVALRDGHIKWIVSGRDEHYPFATERLFPLKLYFLNDKAWVVANYGTTTIPEGVELISINGLSIPAILQRLLPKMTFADGNRIGGKYEDLNHFFSGYYATFIGAPELFDVVYREGNEHKTMRLSPTTESAIKAYTEKHKPATQPPFRLTVTDQQTAVMTVERFWAGKDEPDFDTFLKTSFRDIKTRKVQNLILDLRNNEGGEETWGVRLATYLSDQPFQYYDHISVRQKKKYSFPAWTPKLYVKLRWLVLKKQGEGYVFTKHRGLKKQKPNRDAYRGNLFVLINGSSFSVTTELAARLHADRRKRAGNVTFVGQETGGGYKVNSSGIFTITQLPNSKIDLGIGMFGFHMANVSDNPYADRGIIPDHIVEPTINDVIHQNDTVLNYTLNLIHSQKSALTRSN